MSDQPLSLPRNFWVNSGCREVLSLPLDFECQSPFAVFFEGICAHQKVLDIDPWLVSCDTFHGFFSSVGDSKPAIYQPSGLRVWVQMLRESQILSKLHDVSQVLNSPKWRFCWHFWTLRTSCMRWRTNYCMSPLKLLSLQITLSPGT